MFLGNVEQLGSEVKTAYVNTINSAVQKVGGRQQLGRCRR